jgi:hypothetical protein
MSVRISCAEVSLGQKLVDKDRITYALIAQAYVSVSVLYRVHSPLSSSGAM